jgi:hypothetical protein
MVDVTDFKNAMSMLSAAVNVVTTDGPAGRHGFTASAVCSVTDNPPTLLVCMNTASRSYENFVQNKVLALWLAGRFDFNCIDGMVFTVKIYQACLVFTLLYGFDTTNKNPVCADFLDLLDLAIKAHQGIVQNR